MPDQTGTRRRICLFSDGTGNSAGKLFKTNVWRLYDALDFGDIDQIAYYDDGVGSSSFKPLAVLGGAFGFGLARKVRHIYAFLCRNYQPGDDIYCFGFSRGAFTIRVLLSLIESEGLVRYYGERPNAEALLAADVRSAYRRFSARRNTFGLIAWPVRLVRELLASISYWRGGYPNYTIERNWWAVESTGDGFATVDRATKERCDREEGVDSGNNRRSAIPIKFVGLWDTVAAYGLPIDELTRAWDKYFWPLSIDTRKLPENVERARHALSLDDERNTFHPVLWNEGLESVDQSKRDDVDEKWIAESTDDERISQVWFAGSHADVGGGYPHDGLANVSLNWMIKEVEKEGLRDRGVFSAQPLAGAHPLLNGLKARHVRFSISSCHPDTPRVAYA